MEKWQKRPIPARSGSVCVGVAPVPCAPTLAQPAPGECPGPVWHGVAGKGTGTALPSHPCPEQPSQGAAAEESNLGVVRRTTEGRHG